MRDSSSETTLITIGIPVYNVEKYVEKSLRSALEQDFQLPYEILVVDDCGTDSSMAIVRLLQTDHPKGHIIRIIKHDNNMGLGEARNTAIKNAAGKYLLFLDSDDWLEKNALTLLYQTSIKNDAEITIGSTLKVYENSDKREAFIYPDMVVNHIAAGAYLNVYREVTPLVAYWNKLFLVDFVRKSDMFCVHRIMEDVIPDFRAKVMTNKVATISDVTLYYNERSGSIMDTLWDNDKKRQQTIDTTVDILKRIKQMICQEFNHIDGVYDLYFANLMRYFFLYEQLGVDAKQYQEVNEIEHNCMNFIPSLSRLHGRNARLMYLLLRRKEHNRKSFFKAYRFASSPLGRILKLMISL